MHDQDRARRLLRYFHGCYRADNREGSLLDLFAKKVEHRHVLTEPDELLNGKLPHVPVAEPELLEVQAKADLYRAEKELRLGTVFLVGSVRRDGRSQKLCAPLLSYPARIEEGPDTPFLTAKLEDRRLHFPVLAHLASLGGLAAEQLDPILDALPAAPFDLAQLGRLADTLVATFPEVPAEELRLYPRPLGARELRRRQRATRAGDRLGWVFASAIYLVPRSIDSRGVLSELAQLAGEVRLSAPVRAVLDLADARRPRATPSQVSRWRVPAILSRAQRNVLTQSHLHPLSLVIGPPGTGKSFTIAALALDALERRESVLIASKMNHAVDVVGDKIAALLGEGGFIVRGGRRQYLRDLRQAVGQLLSGAPLIDAEDGAATIRGRRQQVEDLEEELRVLESTLAARSRKEQAWGRIEIDRRRAGGRLRRLWLKARASWGLRRLRAATPYWQLMRRYEATTEQFVEASRQWIRWTIHHRQQQALEKDRASLVRFRKILGATRATRKEELFAGLDPEVLFEALPIWLVNLADVNTVLPLAGEIFDLVIVDEATQCDVASALPLLQRGKRAIIVGDPQQLRHLSFLSRKRQERIAERAQLEASDAARFDYRGQSLLDLVDETIPGQEQVSFLDEHFRSAPSIIAFSNREFYGGRLRVMQERPSHHAGGGPERACDAVDLRFVGGARRDDGAHPAEAAAVVAEVLARIAEEARHPPEMRHSLGILSPFAAQVELLTELLVPHLTSAQREAHRLTVGTPFAFQGEERDILYLSLAIDADSHPASLRFLERPDIFNVAVTRARSRQVVFTSLRPSDLPADSLLRRFLEHMERPQLDAPVTGRGPADPFLEELRMALESQGWKVWPAYPVAGFRVDLVVERDGRALGIDLVGYPGEYAGAFEVERYRLWNRAGLRILPLPYSAWWTDAESCLAAIERAARGEVGRRATIPP